MELKFVLLWLAACAFTTINAIKLATTRQDEAEVDAILAALQSGQSEQPTNWDNTGDTNVLPYDAARKNFFGSVGIHKPATSLSINTGGILAGQSEILRLIEAFLRLKGQIFSHLFILYNDNYEVIRGVANFLVSKIPKLHAFSLTGISVLRKILEFAVHTFSEWTISLPSLNFEAFHNSYAQPHETYGVPSVNVAGFLENLTQK